MKLIEVNDTRQAKKFLMLPLKLYKDVSAYIRPLDKDIENVFDPSKNKAFRHGECTRWLLVDKKEQVIGRVAAFVNRKTASRDNDQPTGGFGFFDCINDKEAAFMLFDQCKSWLEDREIEAMDGPINFGTRDQWWGLLIDGFEIEPNYRCNYNLPYYRQFFEDYGFKVYFNQFTYARVTRDPFNPKLQAKADMIKKDPGYTFSHIKLNNLKKYIEDFRVVYNKAWARHGVPQMTGPQAKNLIYQLKPIIDEKIIWFGYYNNEPISVFILLPEVNQIFKYVNGKMNWIGKLKFIYHKWRKSCNKMFGLVFGVIPEHQGKGVEGAMIMTTAQMVQDDYHRYKYLEMNWIGDFNPKMIRVVEQVGGHVAKTHVTYRKLFDQSKPFKRAEIIN